MTDAVAPVLVVEGGYPGWRAQALRALAAGWPPERITWIERQADSRGMAAPEQLALGDADPLLVGEGGEPAATSAGAAAATLRVSKALAELLQEAARYRSAERWGLLYRVLWRWSRGDRAVASPADDDGARLHAMAKSVKRARHDMMAYVRFHRRAGDAMPEYLAWYEPEHDVLDDVAAHFSRRMGATTWWIGTPGGAALWDGKSLLRSEEPADASLVRGSAGADDIEPLWLAYYRSIFNPARLNEAALRQHMPVRFWKGLPEGPLIPAMVAQARTGAQRVAQASVVGTMRGKTIAIEAQRAQPVRDMPSSLDACRRCDLWRHATRAVPGRGPQTARLMLIGEQPGDQEDLSGRAFVGPAGRVLEDAMQRAGVAPDDLYLTNAVKHFKWAAQGKRRLHKTPGQREVEACAHWLQQERDQVKPAVIVTLGATALRAIVGERASLRDYLDTPVRLDDAWLVATWHPSYALRVDDPGRREQIVAAIAQAIATGRRLAIETDPHPPVDRKQAG